MSQEAAVLFVNDSFYEAFRARDMETMESLWSESESVACIHPGWRALSGREAVMESWAGILANDSAPEIACGNAEAFVAGESAFVVCYEIIGTTVLVATNVFRRERSNWKLVHHQAGPCDLPADAVSTEKETGPVQ